MSERRTTMMDPPIEVLMDKIDSKFGLVSLAAKRARQINSYFNQLGEGLGAIVPPQVTSVARKPLSIAFEEIAADKIVPVDPAEAAATEETEVPVDADAVAASGGADEGATDVEVATEGDGEVSPDNAS